MSVKLKKILKFSILSGLILFFMYLAFRGIDLNALGEELKKTNYWFALLGAFIGVIIGGLIRAYRWRYFLLPIKENIKFENLFSSMMIGYMMNSIVPKSGELSRPLVLAKAEDIPKGSTFGTIIVERIFDMLSLLVSFGICLFFYKEEISNAFGQYELEKYALYASIIIFVFVVTIVLMLLNLERSERIVEKITSKILPKKFNDKIKNIFVSLINGFLFIKHPKKYLIIFILTAALWSSYVLSSYVTFFAFDIPLSFWDANLLLTIITFTLVLPLPGNSVGIFHIFCTTTLVSIFSIQKEAAFGYATVSHLLNLVFLVLIGFYYSIKENIKLRDKL